MSDITANTGLKFIYILLTVGYVFFLYRVNKILDLS
jgi:hypothetical protein